MNRTQSISGALSLAVALALSATGCSLLGGSSSPAASTANASTQSASASPSPTALSADALATKAVADLGQASAYRMKGKILQAGKILSVDLSVVIGKGCQGTMGRSGQGAVRIVELGPKLWIKGDATFWHGAGAPAAAARALSAKYIATSATSPKFASFAKLCDGKILAGSFGTATGMTRGAAATVDGYPVVTLHEADGAVGYVTDTTTPELVRLVASKGHVGQLDFLNFGKPAVITAPPAAQTIPGAKLGA